MNKVIGAILGTLLFGFLVVEVSHYLYPNPRQGEHAEHLGYPVPGMAEAGHDDGGEATAEPSVDLPTLLASADVAAGEAQFRACGSCHNAAAGAGAKVGPNLWGIVGRAIGGDSGFNYSRAMADHGGSWTFENLSRFLESPSDFVPGTAMSYRGMRREGDRANLIAYLRTLSDNPLPLPAASAAEDMMESHSDAMDTAAETTDDMMDAHGDSMDAPPESADDMTDGDDETDMGGDQ